MLALVFGCAAFAGCGGSAGDAGVDWARVEADESLFATAGQDVVITDVCAGGPGLVAVGFRHEVVDVGVDPAYRDKEEIGSPGNLEIWVSNDGRDWSRLTEENYTEGSSSDLGEYATITLRELVGVHADPRIDLQQFTPPRICSGTSGLVITCCLNRWVSCDGLEWTQLSLDDEAFAPEPGAPHLYPVSIVDIAGGSQGYIAVGNLWNEETCNTQPCLWSSSDGEDWTRAPADWIPAQRSPEVYAVNGIGPRPVMTGSIYSLTAVDDETESSATDPSLYYARDAQVWFSDPEGLSWSMVPPDEEVFGGLEDQKMADVAEGGPGLVAVGHDGGLMFDDTPPVRGAVWTSPDGTSWRRADGGDDSFENTTIYKVASGGPGLVAAGKAITITDPRFSDSYFSACVWTSESGDSWTRIDIPRDSDDPNNDQCIYSVASFDRGVVAVGYDTLASGLLYGAIWISTGD